MVHELEHKLVLVIIEQRFCKSVNLGIKNVFDVYGELGVKVLQ